MKTVIFGLGAFGFAISKLIGENNKNQTFYAFEINEEVNNSIKNTRKHPYFFEGYLLPKNIEIIDNKYNLSTFDLIILAIPTQFIENTLIGLKDKLKSGIIILNLAKGIDIKNNKTIYELTKSIFFDKMFNYSVLSGGLIASELVDGKKLGADLGVFDLEVGEKLKKILENNNLDIKIRQEVLNIELYGSLKNILAILVGYYEGRGFGMSSIGYFLVSFYEEMKKIIKIYGGNDLIDFGYYSLGGDLIATCFGNSRNRYFGNLLGKGLKIEEILNKLKNENKHSEGYETLKAVYNKVRNEKGFENIKFLYNLVI